MCIGIYVSLFLFALIAYIDSNGNIGLLLHCYESELLCELCTTVQNVTIKKYLSMYICN